MGISVSDCFIKRRPYAERSGRWRRFRHSLEQVIEGLDWIRLPERARAQSRGVTIPYLANAVVNVPLETGSYSLRTPGPVYLTKIETEDDKAARLYLTPCYGAGNSGTLRDEQD